MSYSYFDHEADIGIMGDGKTLEEAFEQGAQAMLDLISAHQGKSETSFEIENRGIDLETLWISFLNELLAQMDLRDVFISSCKVRWIRKNETGFYLKGDVQVFSRKGAGAISKSEVKAATYCKVEVVQDHFQWKVQCVVDI